MSASPSHTTDSPRILLAIEDDVVGNVLEHRLRRHDIYTERVVDKENIWAHLENRSYELLVIEDRLPGLTALDVLREYSNRPVTGSPGVVVLGREGKSDELVRAFELGAVEYLLRPFSPEVAVARIVRFAKPVTIKNKNDRQLAALLPFAAVSESMLTLPEWMEAFGADVQSVGAAWMSVFDGWPAPLVAMTLLTIGLLLITAISAGLSMFANARNRRRKRERRQLKDEWTPVLMKVLSGEADPEVFAEAVPSGRERLALDVLARYAIKLRGPVRSVLVDVAEPFLSAVEKDLEKGVPAERARALQLVGMLGRSTQELLRASLDDGALLVEQTAMRQLADVGDASDVERVLARIDRFAMLDTRQVASLLVKFGHSATIPLRNTLRDSEASEFARVAAAEALRWLGDSGSASIARVMLAQDPPAELGAALLRLLRRVGHERHADIVRTYCEANVDFLRIHAARALGQLGSRGDRSLLFHLLTSDQSRWVALNAAESLAELGERPLLQRFSRANHPHASLVNESLYGEMETA